MSCICRFFCGSCSGSVRSYTITSPNNHFNGHGSTINRTSHLHQNPEANQAPTKPMQNNYPNEKENPPGVIETNNPPKENVSGSPPVTIQPSSTQHSNTHENTNASVQPSGNVQDSIGKQNLTHVDSNNSLKSNTITDTNVQDKTTIISSSKSDSVSSPRQSNFTTTESEMEVNRGTNSTDYEELEVVRRRSGINVTYNKSEEIVINTYPKTEEETQLIRTAIENNDFLNKILSGRRLDDVILAMYSRKVKKNEILITEGQVGSHMYVSGEGKFEANISGKVVKEYKIGEVFGELALLYSDKRLATVKATSNGKVWVLDRDVFQKLRKQYNVQEQDEIISFLENVKTLNKVGRQVLQKVAQLLKEEFFTSGTVIVRQGERGDTFYIIRAGEVAITKEGEGVVGTYSKGQYFGELALLQDTDKRQATVTAKTPVECLTLTRREFQNHFGTIDDIASIKIDKPRRANRRSEVKPTEHADIDLRELRIIKTLGVGGFGRVELVQHRKQKDLVFALKYLKKSNIVEQGQQDHVYNEKYVQMSSKSEFIVRLYKTFKDKKYIYFLMEPCLGGDLWNLLQKQPKRRFEEKDAQFIAACVVECLEYLHNRNIVYRDLKPENILIDAKGYIKLTDFGFAKELLPGDRTQTFAGTPEYVAPEIVLGKLHDKGVDHWALGIFIFELFTGKTPFRTSDPTHMKTYHKILNGIDSAPFPNHIPAKARNIIEKLCRPLAADRLGMQKNGIKDIKNHSFFKGFDWQKLKNKEMKSPFSPKLKDFTDTSHFETYSRDIDDPPEENSGWDKDF